MKANGRFYKPPREPALPVTTEIQCDGVTQCVLVQIVNQVSGSVLWLEMSPAEARSIGFQLYRVADHCEDAQVNDIYR